ncbi:MAG: hypothetical protein Q8W45_01985 [Candidatus Palauibacterales bacterium]|nr:hypothetical protein [Candidatus Palauibacterales bacterium]MDP2482025.1 hypothetical protein [Candidatus Palauibacterales bacterium]
MRSFKVLALGLSVLVAFTFVACDQQQPTEPEADQAQFELGNGYPVPSFDYKLNILGVPQDKSADMDNNNGRRIFVQLWGGGTVTNPGGKNNGLKGNDKNKIYLCNSTNGENDYNKDDRCNDWNTANPNKDFGVIDANATDDNGALFALPDPCADADSKTACDPSYAIWARAKAGSGSATITTCAEEYYDPYPTGYDIWCGDNGVTLSKQTAFRAVDVSTNLLYMNITIDGVANPQLAACVGTSTTGSETINIYLFDNCFENYFWNYDNNGLKNLELRFYWAD